MSVIATRKLSEIAEKIGAGADPKAALLFGIGQKHIDDFEPALNLILLATYVRGEKTKGGIIIGGDRTRAEDRFQGKVGLVLKFGPLVNASRRLRAEYDLEPLRVFNTPIEIGDWLMYRTSDAMEAFMVDEKTGLDGSSVRLLEDGLVMGRVKDPEAIY